jgi:hypothetical protein
VADTSKFGGGRGAQFGDRISPGADAGHCAQCEAMLADALDGTLSPEDQALFDTHMAICGPCSEMLADAQRGAAWLEMLRDPRPEPPAELLERILAQTSGLAVGHVSAPAPAAESAFILEPGPRGVIVPFRQRFAEGLRKSSFFHGLLQPRLAMTAAMAFFSIALTMNLTGVRLTGLRPGDLKPSNIKQGFYSANARVVRYYEGLRVVYELESRVHDLESESDASTTDTRKTAPAGSGLGAPEPSGAPDRTAPEPTKPPAKAPGPGSSSRENLMPKARFMAVDERFSSRHQTIQTLSTKRVGSAGNDCIDVRKVRALA